SMTFTTKLFASDTNPVRNTVLPLSIETCSRLVGTQIPYNKRSYDTTTDKEANRQIFKFTHNLPGLQSFHSFYQELEKVSGQPPAIIFESTGHYHEPVLHFLEDNDIAYYLVNPVISFEARKTNLRQVKTDKADAYHLGELYYKEDLAIYQKKTEKALNLRLLTRQHSALTDSYVQIKLQFQVALDQVFPEYHTVFS